MALATPAFATPLVTIDMVSVDHLGNTADTNGLGDVNYGYKIGKYEVTNAQYTVFLNAVDPTGTETLGLYNAFMGSESWGGISKDPGASNGSKYSVKTNMGNKPVNYVSWYDAARFTNWLHNGATASSNTETGAYTLNGNTGLPTRNAGAQWWLPNNDEWYKAAYYDDQADKYWTYATQSDVAPTKATVDASGNISNPGANVANYNQSLYPFVLTTVGSAGPLSESFFGTADQSGNVWEWTDTETSGGYGYRGGSSNIKTDATALAKDYELGFGPTAEYWDAGFRVAAVPEPSGLVLTMLISAGFICHRRR